MSQPLRHTAHSTLDLIGNTPLVEITHIDTGRCRLFVKLESQNPGGSIKDRIALSMIEAAERSHKLKPGGTIVEATAGNTGIGLAQVGVLKGYRILLVVPDKMAREKIEHLRALGAEVIITRSDVSKGHPDYYQDKAKQLAKGLPHAHYIDQFSNPANPLAHERTTGPEIWEQMDQNLDAVVVGVGSGGTLSGLGRFLRRVSPKTKMILADPEGSVLAPFIKTGELIEAGSWAVEGIGEDFVPPNADLSLVSEAYSSTRRGFCWRAKAFLPDRRRARCWRQPCAFAGSRRRSCASSPSSATTATNIFPKSTTTTGPSSRASKSVP
jgi:cystathionine beta-synthase